MYIYYDKNKVLKEIVNTEAIVASSGSDIIYVYFEKQEEETFNSVTMSFRKSDGTIVPQSPAVGTLVTNNEEKKIPYNKDRDLKYFKYGVEYPFYKWDLSEIDSGSLLTEEEVVAGTPIYGTNTLELFTFFIEDAAIDLPQAITLSQFQYLVNLFGNREVNVVQYYPSQSEIDKYATGSLVWIKSSNIIYEVIMNLSEKSLNLLINLQFLENVGFVNISDLSNELTDFEKLEVQKQTCILMYNKDIYIKTETVSGTNLYVFENVNNNIISGTDTLTIKSKYISINTETYAITEGDNTYYTYNKDASDSIFAKLAGNNTFSGTNVFENNVPETAADIVYNPSNLNQLANTGKLKEVSDDLAAEVSARESADALLIPKSWKGNADGVASLDNQGKIPLSQLPDIPLGQLKFGGTLYIFSADDIATSFNILNTGVVILSANAKELLNAATVSSITVNGIYANGNTNFISFNDLFNLMKNNPKALGLYFVVNYRKHTSGYIGTGASQITNISFYLTDTALYPLTTDNTTGDWLVVNNVLETTVQCVKIDNTDAVSGVKGSAESTYRTGNVNITKANIGLEYIETDIAPYWNSANTYVVGDLVIYNGKLYKCIVDIPTPENNFVPFHWQSTSVKTLLKTLPQYVDITILTTDWSNNECSKNSGVLDLGEYDIVLCLPNGYENDAYIRAFGVELSSFVNETGVATFSCMETPTETIHITLQVLRR